MVFADEFERVTASRGRMSNGSPNAVLEAWEDFVRECEEGYSWTIYEYDNEIAVRATIEATLQDPAVRSSSGFEAFKERLAPIDERFQILIGQGPKISDHGEWWERRLPPRGGTQFLEDVRSSYHVDIIPAD